jgi:periplasmic protein TonB
MPNQQSSRQTANTFFPFPSSPVLDARGRGRAVQGPVSSGKRVAAPEIWGQFNNYRSDGLKWSAGIHVVLVGLLLGSALIGPKVVQQVQKKEVVTLIAPSLDAYALPVAKKIASGGGGGGDRDKLQATKGALPKPALEQITPPAIVVRNQQPKLAVAPTVVVPPQVHVAANHMPNLGLPTAALMPSAPPSNGTGSGGGIGSGSGGGVGVGHGPGVGAGSGGGIGGGVYKVGGGISAPQAISTPDPTYTEEARNAKAQGTCILWLIVDDKGNPRDIRVVRGLGYGLDGKAIEAVKQWRFEPAMKDGHPVNVQISVEVGFRLY